MRFVRIKSAEQQGQLMQRRTRDVLIRQRTQIINALRAHLAELGFVAAQGNAGVNELRAIVTDEAGRYRAAWWPRSSGTRASYIPALASSSPTCRARPSGSSPSTTSAGRASNGSSKARERSSGRGCHAARSPPTLRARRLVSDHCIVRHGRYVIFQFVQCRRNCSTRSDAGAARGDQVFSFMRWPTISPTSCGP